MLALLLLAQVPPVQVTNVKANATAVATRCVNAAGTAFESCGGAAGAAPSYVNVLVDGGWMTVTVINRPYVDAFVSFDGGYVTTNGLTDIQLRASAVPVSAAALPLPSGASTSALQTTGNTSVGNIDTKTPALGQTTMAGSSPVAIASNQSSIPVTLTSTTITGTVAATQSGTWTVQPGNTPNTAPWLYTPRKVAAAALSTAFSCTSAAAVAPTTALTNRTSLCITNLSPHTTVYVGHAAVTASTGTALAPAPTQTDGGIGVGGTYCDDVGPQPISCITSTGTADVRLLEQ